MKLIFCVDDRMGLAFNKRRQSRDRVVIEKILENNRGKKITVSPYSESLFGDVPGVEVRESLSEGETCFAEREITEEMMKKADELEVYFWNRAYPGDSFAEINEEEFCLTEEEEFQGSSHEKITRRKYMRRK